MAVEPNALLLSDERVPTITLAGKVWPIPKLALEQLEIVAPVVLKLQPLYLGAMRGAVADGATDEAQANAVRALVTTDTLRDLAVCVYWALRRGHPALTREEFNTWEVNISSELLPSFWVISRQSGLMKEGPAQGDAAPLGERKGPSSQTGPGSRRSSARAPAGRRPTSGRS